jgi:hypothetical protein
MKRCCRGNAARRPDAAANGRIIPPNDVAVRLRPLSVKAVAGAKRSVGVERDRRSAVAVATSETKVKIELT